MAFGATAAAGLHLPLFGRVSTASAAALALLPVWWPMLVRFRGSRLILTLGLISGISGLVLVALAPWDQDFDSGVGRGQLIFTATWLCVLGMLLWSREVLGLRGTTAAFALGLLAAAQLEIGTSANPWKYQLSVPVTLLLLSAIPEERWRLSLPVLGGLAVTGVLLDSRSYAGICVLTAVMVAWQRESGSRGGASSWRSWLFLGSAGVGTYLALSSLLLQGALGTELQQRSVTQVESGGNLLLGGRPEWAAALGLMRASPLGIGVGATPTTHQTLLAKGSLSATVGGVDSAYVERYLFGSGFELHSAVADFWAWFGIPGAMLALAMALLIIKGIAMPPAGSYVASGAVFAGMGAVWSIFFGPPFSDFPLIVLAVALLLAPAGREPDPITAQESRDRVQRHVSSVRRSVGQTTHRTAGVRRSP